MSQAPSVAVIGGSVAGHTVVTRLREAGYTGDITLIDPHGLPYDRPPLSTEYLTRPADADADADVSLLLAPAEWYDQHHVRLIPATVTRFDLNDDAGHHTLHLRPATHASVPGLGPGPEPEPEPTVQAQRIVLATGAEPRRVGHSLTVRTRDDVEQIRTLLAEHDAATPPVVAVIGAGLLGAELASSLRALGAEVLLFAGDTAVPGTNLFGPDIAALLHRQHEAHGVRVIDEKVRDVVGADPVQVITETGTSYPVAGAVSAIGVTPSTELAEAAGLTVHNGVVVDAGQRTSHPEVLAVGDVARQAEAAQRTEHWQHALDSAVRAANTLMGSEVPEPGAPWFWSDRYDSHVEVVGTLDAAATADGSLQVVHRRDPDRPHTLTTFVVDQHGALLGAASVDDPTAIRVARRLMDRHIPVDPAALADPQINLRTLLRR